MQSACLLPQWLNGDIWACSVSREGRGEALRAESVAFVIYCVLARIVPVGKGAAG